MGLFPAFFFCIQLVCNRKLKLPIFLHTIFSVLIHFASTVLLIKQLLWGICCISSTYTSFLGCCNSTLLNRCCILSSSLAIFLLLHILIFNYYSYMDNFEFGILGIGFIFIIVLMKL